MSSPQDIVFDSSELGIVESWLKKGKGNNKLLSDTQNLGRSIHEDIGEINAGDRLGLGYVRKGRVRAQEQKSRDIENDNLRRKLVGSKKNKGLTNGNLKGKRRDQEDDELDLGGPDRELEVSRTEIGKKTGRGLPNEKRKVDDIQKYVDAEKETNNEREDVKKDEGSKYHESEKLSDEIQRKQKTLVRNGDESSSYSLPILEAKVCINYSSRGQCRFGDMCRYSHHVQPGSGEGLDQVAVTDASQIVGGKRRRKKVLFAKLLHYIFSFHPFALRGQ